MLKEQNNGREPEKSHNHGIRSLGIRTLFFPERMRNVRKVVLTHNQYEWLYWRARDSNGNITSEWSGEIIENASVHHIEGSFWMITHQKAAPEQYNHPTNLIILSQKEHDYLHPDRLRLAYLQKDDPRQFKIERNYLIRRVKSGYKDWIIDWDDELRKLATERTNWMFDNGYPWPVR